MCIICNNSYNKDIIKLKIENCKKIKEIPKTLINLKSLKISKCDNLNIIPKELINLEKLYIHYYNNVRIIPIHLQKLQKIQIDYNHINNPTIYFYSNNSQEIKKILNYIYQINN
jgi:hypothetical protein